MANKTSAGLTGLDNLLKEIEKGLKNIYGSKLRKIIIYGSYAKKTNDEGSDLDIMALVDMQQEEIKKMHDRVLDVTVDLSVRYGVVLSIIEDNYDHFNEWVDVIPFYKNIERDGVRIYG